jgi:cell fate regulator YaaT (PSP1 superfamily)
MIATARRWVKSKNLPRIIRRASTNDSRQKDRNRHKELEALTACQNQIASLRLPMKLIEVDYLHGGNKAVFYFASEGRVDFRDIVRELARQLHVRVEMRQVGIRDAARMIGGIGTCGQQLCCNRYIREFGPVSIRMAKDQDLVLNPEKVSGICGRLMCCLAYEEQAYRESARGMPRIGKRVMTPDGEGRVRDRDILRRRVRVQVASQEGFKEYPVSELSPPPDLERRGDRDADPRNDAPVDEPVADIENTDGIALDSDTPDPTDP